MSALRVPIVRVREVIPIPKADRLELATVDGFRSVVAKGSVAPGDLVAYLPEGAVVPEWLLHHLNLWIESEGRGRLFGPGGDRVGPARMRSVLSEGVVVPLRASAVPDERLVTLASGQELRVREGDEIATSLGVTKWRPEIPPELRGRVVEMKGRTLRFDIENRKAFPDVLVEGEPVAYTEKIHGVFCAIGAIPGLAEPRLFHGGEVYVASKDPNGSGLVFADVPENADNRYLQALASLEAQVGAMRTSPPFLAGLPVHVLGEIYGLGVQRRFDYGRDGAKRTAFRVFDVFVGEPTKGRYLDFDEKREFATSLGFELVDLFYRGPHSSEEMLRHRDGASVTGRGANIREGIVVTPLIERRDDRLGRVILKEVSPAYLGQTDGDELS